MIIDTYNNDNLIECQVAASWRKCSLLSFNKIRDQACFGWPVILCSKGNDVIAMLPVGSQRIQSISRAISPFMQFFEDPAWASRIDDPAASNFVFGNPHEMPLAEFSSALQRWSTPQNKDWFAYKMSEPGAQEVVAETLRRRFQMPFEPDDVCLTNGAFAAIAVALGAITDPGDEIIYVSPPWFFYEALIVSHHGTPVRVRCDPDTFDLDLSAIEAAITPQTRAIIVNSPNNPTGRIYPPATLRALADLLEAASQRIGHTIFLLSDESYNRIVFDGREFPTPTAYYPDSFLLYTYGKTLLTPGQRIGYIALPPSMARREQMRAAILTSQLVTGWAFPNALLQHALPDLEKLSIDIEHLQAKRDRLVAALGEMGYELSCPEGTFYLLVRSPLADDMAFCRRLAEHSVLVLPGSVYEMPGTFRISLTANDEMISWALPGFAAALRGI